MTLKSKVINVASGSTPEQLKTAIDVELLAIDTETGTLVNFTQYFDTGCNAVCITFVYTTA